MHDVVLALILFGVAAAILMFASSANAAPAPPPAIAQALYATFPGEQTTARCVAWNESRYNLRAVSPTGDYGLMQINRWAHSSWVVFQWSPTVWPIFRLDYNLRVAKRLYLAAKRRTGNGWTPWVAYRRHCR